VAREAFAGFPMPRKTPLFAPTFDGEGAVRSDDITQDPRYGRNFPHRGMPKGHLPVRSYLAVPVKSRTGEVLGGLFLGHPAGTYSRRATSACCSASQHKPQPRSTTVVCTNELSSSWRRSNAPRTPFEP